MFLHKFLHKACQCMTKSPLFTRLIGPEVSALRFSGLTQYREFWDNFSIWSRAGECLCHQRGGECGAVWLILAGPLAVDHEAERCTYGSQCQWGLKVWTEKTGLLRLSIPKVYCQRGVRLIGPPQELPLQTRGRHLWRAPVLSHREASLNYTPGTGQEGTLNLYYQKIVGSLAQGPLVTTM